MDYIKNLVKRYPCLASCEADIQESFIILKDAFLSGHTLFIAGNGGSNSDAEHIAGELMKGFLSDRKLSENLSKKLLSVDSRLGEDLSHNLQQGLPTIVLSNHQSLNTAYANDIENGGLFTFAQQVNVYGKQEDVLLVISTSGNSKNLIYASVVAKAKGMKIIELTGESGGRLKEYADCSIKVPETETYKVQELHLPVYHCLCMMLENYFYKD